MEKKYPLPPFDLESAKQKVQMAEDGWNSKNAEKVALAYSEDTEWRNRNQFVKGREGVINFLKDKWKNEQGYKLKKELSAFTDNKIAVRFEYEYNDLNGQWYRAYGNENWEFDENGLMEKRYASINDLCIDERDRRL